MNALFHRAKHWQLFTLLYGGIILFEVLMFVNMSSVFANNIQNIQMNQPPKMSGFFWYFFPMILIMVAIVFGWQWSVAVGLRDKLPRGVHMNHRLFKGFFWVAALYPLFHTLFILMIFSGVEDVMVSQNPFQFFQIWVTAMLGMFIMIPIALFAMFCMFYTYYFCAKALKSIELGYEAQLGDYIGYFFLFWFNFVGFWLIQPSVNKITSEGWVPPTPPPGYAPPTDPDPAPLPIREKTPRGELLKTKDHEAFEHDDDFDGLF